MPALDFEFDDELDLDDAEAALQALAEQYPGYAIADVAEMKTRLDALRAAGLTSEAEIESLHMVAHNVKGQGAAFGYDLMTVLGDQLCLILRGRHDITPAEALRVEALIAACGRVLAERLTGMGGEAGRALLEGVGVDPDAV